MSGYIDFSWSITLDWLISFKAIVVMKLEMTEKQKIDVLITDSGKVE